MESGAFVFVARHIYCAAVSRGIIVFDNAAVHRNRSDIILSDVVAIYIYGTAVFHGISAKAATIDVHFALLILQISNAAVFTVGIADVSAKNIKSAFIQLNAAAVAHSVGSALKCALFAAAAANYYASAAVYDEMCGAAACEGACFFVKTEVKCLSSADDDVVFKGYGGVCGDIEVRLTLIIGNFSAVPWAEHNCAVRGMVADCHISAANTVGVTRNNREFF